MAFLGQALENLTSVCLEFGYLFFPGGNMTFLKCKVWIFEKCFASLLGSQEEDELSYFLSISPDIPYSSCLTV